MRHMTDRKPSNRCESRAWWRFCSEGSTTVMYRLWRRSSVDRRWFNVSATFTESDSPRDIANQLRRQRVKLRDRVDAYDLELMGVTTE